MIHIFSSHIRSSCFWSSSVQGAWTVSAAHADRNHAMKEFIAAPEKVTKVQYITAET